MASAPYVDPSCDPRWESVSVLSPIAASIVETSLELVELFGLPVLFLIFLSKGMLVGKIFPTSVFLPGYVILTRASMEMAVVIVLVTAIAYVLGQWVIFVGCRRYGRSFLEQIPYLGIDTESDRFARFDHLFNRYGGFAIFWTNFIPWIRGLATIPAATSSYSWFYYLIHTTTSTVLYHAAYVIVGLVGLEVITRLW